MGTLETWMLIPEQLPPGLCEAQGWPHLTPQSHDALEALEQRAES